MTQPSLFRRVDENPILTRDHWPYAVNTVFNAAACEHAGETLLLVRVEERTGASHLTVARSKDGISNWRVEDKPALLPHPNHPEEQWGVEDPRITKLNGDGRYAVTYTGFSPEGPLVCLAMTSDFKSWDRQGVALCPENKDAALFEDKIDGRWMMIHRPVSGNAANIWVSSSPDLVHWGSHRVLLQARSGPYWDAGKIGLSAQPLKTDEGWLILYHGVKHTCFGSIYRQGLALLDLEDPTKVISRTQEWVFSPQELWERTGDVGNVVFSCGWTLSGDEVRLYYAGADSCMAVAVAPLSDVLTAVKAG